MNLNIRKFKDEDFDEVLKLCQDNHKYDDFYAELLKEKIYEDPFFDDQLIWVNIADGKIVGFLMGVCRMNIRNVNYGYVKLMVVDENYRRWGIARHMYLNLENGFREREIDVIRLGDVPMNYFMPGIDPRYTPAICFAMRMGFNRFTDTANLMVDLTSRKWDSISNEKCFKDKGVELRRAVPQDKKELMSFISAEWKLWQYELEVAFNQEPIAIHIAILNDKIGAFSAHSANNRGMPWFGPMGTHPQMRGMGIGKVLLFRCLDDLKNIGHSNAIIPWVGPVDFYSHHAGAVIERVFWRYEKRIEK